MWEVAPDEWRSAVMQRHRRDGAVGATVHSHALGAAVGGVAAGGLVAARASAASSGRDVLLACAGVGRLSAHVATHAATAPRALGALAYADVAGLNGGRALVCDWTADDRLLLGTDTGMLALYNPSGAASAGALAAGAGDNDDAASSEESSEQGTTSDAGSLRRRQRRHSIISPPSNSASGSTSATTGLGSGINSSNPDSNGNNTIIANSASACMTFSHMAHADAALQTAARVDRASAAAVLPATCVAACPYDASAFATTGADCFRVWTLGQGVPCPVLTHRPAPGAALRRFEWSPLLQPVAALAADRGAFLVADIRGDRPVAVRREHAHAQPLTALAWNPYVPYWLATAGADAHVRVWDLRFAAAPVATVADLVGPVTALAWDPRHSELLAVGTTDAALALFSMELDPHRLLLRKPTPSSVLAVGFLPAGGAVADCFALTDTGDLVVASLDETFFGPLRSVQSMVSSSSSASASASASHSYPPPSSSSGATTAAGITNIGITATGTTMGTTNVGVTATGTTANVGTSTTTNTGTTTKGWNPTPIPYAMDQKALEVENKIYARDIQAGFSMAYKRACELNALDKTEEALALLNMCFEATPEQITAGDLSAALAPPPGGFLDEARFFAAHVPLGYHARFQTRLDDTLTESLDRLKLVLDLKTMVRQRQPEEIVPRHLEIATSLRSDKNRIDVTLLYQVVATVLDYDYLQAVRMALDYATIFALQRQFSLFSPIAHLVLYPTVFDEEVAAASPLLTSALGLLADAHAGNDDESEYTTRSISIATPGSNTSNTSNTSSPAPVTPTATPSTAPLGKESTSFEVLLSKPEVMLDQIRFLRMYLEAAWSSDPAREVRAVMRRRARLKPFVLSFEAVAVYLNTLAAAHEFHHYFAFLVEAETRLAACATPNVVQLFYPLGLRQLGAFLAAPLVDPRAAWDTTALENAVSSVVFVTSHRTVTTVAPSDALLLQFRKTLADIAPALETALRSLARTPDPAMLEKGIPAKAQASLFVFDSYVFFTFHCHHSCVLVLLLC